MHQLNDIEMMREHRQALLGEAEGERLARRLKGIRPNRESSYAGRMRRRAALLPSTIGLAVLLAASAAYALDIQCPPSIGGEHASAPTLSKAARATTPSARQRGKATS